MASSDANLLSLITASRPGAAPTLLRSALPVVVIVALAVMAQVVLKGLLGGYYADLAITIGVNIVLAVSLTIVNGFTGQFSMGHAGFLAVGGYVSGAVTYYFSLTQWGSAAAAGGRLSGMPLSTEGLAWLGAGDVLFPVALLIGGLVSALLGLAVGLPSLRLRGDYLAIVTLGFGEIIRVVIQQSGPALKTPEAAEQAGVLGMATGLGGALGFGGLPKYTSLFWVVLFAGLTMLVAYRIKTSTSGRAMLSVREDEIAAEAMGVNTTRTKVWAFVIAAFFAGIAGGLYAHKLGVALGPVDAGFQRSFDIIIMVVLGGLGSISGAALAAVVVTMLPEYLRAVADYRMIIFALALILMMILRPKGLLGVREVWDADLWRGLFRRGKSAKGGGK
ncbi:MAG: branched-chain amino acid ABC transporter permease [Planctomycetes bacterium]|nr:branched-chain amino acid ABC transporter permease [Planctomycetota bacterium]